VKLLFFIICFHAFLLVQGQLPDYHVQLFDESFGIRTSEVRKVLMDHKGFVWILNNDRIQRFDGKHIKDYILEGSVHQMFCDRHNHIWASSLSTLFKYENDRQGFVPVKIDTIKNLGVSNIYQFPGMDVWVWTSNGFYGYNETTKIFTKNEDPVIGNLGRTQNRGTDATSTSFFFCMDDSIVAYNLSTHLRRALPLPEHNIRFVNALTDDKVFISIWKGILYLYDFSKKEIRDIDVANHRLQVQDEFITVFEALQIRKDLYLLATTKSIIEYDIGTDHFRKLKLFHKGKPLEGNLVFNDLHIDSTGIAWAAYANYGLVVFRPGNEEIGLVRNYEPEINKAWDNHVRNFAEDDDDHLWLATFNGFVSWDMQTGIIQPYFAKEGGTDMLNHPSIRGIVYDGTNLILGQTNRGIWIYNPKTRIYRRPSYLPGEEGEMTKQKLEDSFTEQIYTLQNGDHIITGNAAYRIDKDSYQVTVIDFADIKEGLNFTFQDSKKNIWIGGDRNLYCLDDKFQHKFRLSNKQTSGNINAMCEWTDSSLIIGGPGLHLITVQDTVPAITPLNGFFDNIIIRTIYRDLRDKIWLTTSEGLFRYDMQTQKIESFSNFESIEGNSFYGNSYLRSKNGLLFLGSTRGIIYLNPEKIGEKIDSLNIFITDITVNEDDSTQYSVHASASLNYEQNNLAFDFIAPFYGKASKLRYRYRLTGLNSDWIDNENNNTARFHSLAPGDYIFQAAASTNGVDWIEGADQFAFSISPPFWTTWWFYMLVLLSVVSVVYSLYRYQLNKKLEVERLRMGIARDLHDDIGSALSHIHIISSMAMKKQPENGNAELVIGKIKESSKAILENMQDIVWAINPQNDTLEQVVSKMKEFAGEICEAAGIEYVFDTDQSIESIKLTVSKRKDLFLVFKEAMNNAVKYSGGSLIRVSLHKKPNGWLALNITDNGKGFVNHEIQPGNGLRNMNERAKEVNGEIYIKSEKGMGTHVELWIPIT